MNIWLINAAQDSGLNTDQTNSLMDILDDGEFDHDPMFDEPLPSPTIEDTTPDQTAPADTDENHSEPSTDSTEPSSTDNNEPTSTNETDE